MFKTTIERLAKTAWVREGWPLAQVVVRVVTAVITGATIYAYVRKPHGPGAAWWLAAAFAIAALWAILEMVRLKIRHRPLGVESLPLRGTPDSERPETGQAAQKVPGVARSALDYSRTVVPRDFAPRTTYAMPLAPEGHRVSASAWGPANPGDPDVILYEIVPPDVQEKPTLAADPEPPLVVTIEDFYFEDWRQTVWFLLLSVRIRNTTARRIMLGDPPPHLEPMDVETDPEVVQALKEFVRKHDDGTHGVPFWVSPSPSEESCWITGTARRRLDGGIPKLTVVVTDKVGSRYEATRPEQIPQTYKDNVLSSADLAAPSQTAQMPNVPRQDEAQASRQPLQSLLAEMLLKGDNLRIALDRACDPLSGMASWDIPANPAPDEGAALAQWLDDCEASIKDLMGAPHVVDMRMYRGGGTAPYYAGRDNVGTYSTALKYIAWLRLQLVKLDGLSNLDFKGGL